jgi:hypothetical protein
MDNDFDRKSANLIRWLESAGAHLNPKLTVLDLRAEGKGRGIGLLSRLLQLHFRLS